MKAVTAAFPKKIAADAWSMIEAGKPGWSYERWPARYVFNAHADFRYVIMDAAPAVSVWAWPDRSDLCLQAFLDTVAAGGARPMTLLLPDVPAYRSFARRYVRGERMTRVARAQLEDRLYQTPGEVINKRGYVLSAEFGPRLVVYPDGTEDTGDHLTSALAYLSAHHTVRLTVWDILADALLRASSSAARIPVRPFSVSDQDRQDMGRWYTQLIEFEDMGALLSPYRPSLLDVPSF